MQAPTGATPTPDSAKQPYFTLTDFIFVVIAVVVGILVVRLGATTWTEGMHTEATKANGEQFAAWLEEAGNADPCRMPGAELVQQAALLAVFGQCAQPGHQRSPHNHAARRSASRSPGQFP